LERGGEKKNTVLDRAECFSNFINPVTKLVIPAVAERRAGIKKKPFDYWIPAFAGMMEIRKSI
jgi:hypothetical protein